MIEVLTGLLVIITGFYAWATYKILKANERVVDVMHSQFEAMTRPYVNIAPILDIDSPMFRLKISNTGKTAAKNLRLIVDKDFFLFGKKENSLASFPAFQDEIASFAPGAEIVIGLVIGTELFTENYDEKLTPKQFSITANYSYGGNTVEEPNAIDLHPYDKTTLPQDVHATRLKEIKKEIENVSVILKQLLAHRM